MTKIVSSSPTTGTFLASSITHDMDYDNIHEGVLLYHSQLFSRQA